jgi:hypothetical protein
MWRIKHIPTGMYYTPVRETTVGGSRVKTNLNKNGKVYFGKPSLKESCSHGFNNHLNPRKRVVALAAGQTWEVWDSTFDKYVPADWRIEEIR